ncbi:hypothetical protein BD779DRAFT_1577913 [Infundibulicybe gibba]|nr:hypothetical protein BD779DRAFT_1577913 [Infundibulicybe gibba]
MYIDITRLFASERIDATIATIPSWKHPSTLPRHHCPSAHGQENDSLMPPLPIPSHKREGQSVGASTLPSAIHRIQRTMNAS